MDKRVLIVDDDDLSCLLLEKMCRLEGYEVAVARDGEEALAQIPAFAPRVILLDLMMPRLDGFEVCRHVKADPVLSRTQVVVCTALDDVHSRVAALDCGADDFLGKPFRRPAILARLERAFVRWEEGEQTGPARRVGDYAQLGRALAAEAARAQRSKEPYGCVVVLGPLTAGINTAGRREVLASWAELLVLSLRESDAVHLLGDEQLVVLLPGCDEAAAQRVAERVRQALGDPAAAVGAAVGWGESRSDLVRRARSAAIRRATLDWMGAPEIADGP